MRRDQQAGGVPSWLSRGALAWVACLLLLLSFGCVPKAPSDASKTIEDLQGEIRAIEFINRLQLTDEQTRALIDILTPAEAERTKAAEDRQGLRAELVPLLEEKRARLLDDGSVTPAAATRIREIEDQLLNLEFAAPDAQSALAEELRGALSDKQIRAATGALQARIQAADQLDGYRDLPADAFDNEMRYFVPELVEGSDISADELEALLREARSLSDEEYAAAKADLLTRLEPLFMPVGATADYLLVRAFSDPHMLPALTASAAPGTSHEGK